MAIHIDEVTTVLARTPPALTALLTGLPEAWTYANEGPETFSAFDVVGHLIDGEETDWLPRASIILSRASGARFEPYDRFRHRERNAGRTLASLLDEFAHLRARNLDTLKGWCMEPPMMDLTAVHPALGQVTLGQLLATWVVHDLGHLAQASRVMAKRYRAEVGPWVPYLPILTDHETPRS